MVVFLAQYQVKWWMVHIHWYVLSFFLEYYHFFWLKQL
jgi:hypothetical protein